MQATRAALQVYGALLGGETTIPVKIIMVMSIFLYHRYTIFK